jgi:hypothetical protein
MYNTFFAEIHNEIRCMKLELQRFKTVQTLPDLPKNSPYIGSTRNIVQNWLKFFVIVHFDSLQLF